MEMSCVCSAIGNARITLHTVKVGRDRERGSAGRPGRALWISGSSLQWEPSRDLLFHLQGTVRKPVQHQPLARSISASASSRFTTTAITTITTTTIRLRVFCSLPLPPPCPPPLLPLSPSSNTYLHHAQPTGPKCRDRSIHALSLSHPFLVCAAPGSIGNNDIAYQTRGPEHINHLRTKEDAPTGQHTCAPSRDSTGRVQSVREHRPQVRPILTTTLSATSSSVEGRPRRSTLTASCQQHGAAACCRPRGCAQQEGRPDLVATGKLRRLGH